MDGYIYSQSVSLFFSQEVWLTDYGAPEELKVSLESVSTGSEPDELVAEPFSLSLPAAAAAASSAASASVFLANRPPLALALLIACLCLDS